MSFWALFRNRSNANRREEGAKRRSRPLLRHRYKVLKTERDLQEYWRLAVRSMLTPRYGLKSTIFLTPEIREWRSHWVVAAYGSRGELLAALRLIPKYPVGHFQIDSRFACARCLVVGASVYYSNKVDGHQRPVLWRGLFYRAKRLCEAMGIRIMYAEVRMDQVRRLSRSGFKTAGPVFQVDGWSGHWTPMVLQIKKVPRQRQRPTQSL